MRPCVCVHHNNHNRRARTLVAEHLAQFKHALDPAHHQLLEVQLGRDAELQRGVQGAAVRLEGARQGTAGQCGQRWRFHFDEPLAPEVVP